MLLPDIKAAVAAFFIVVCIDGLGHKDT